MTTSCVGGGGGGSGYTSTTTNLKLINANTAHSRGWTGSGVTVAVVDTGVDTDHPDLDANIVAGYDYIGGDSDPNPVGQGAYRSHGTHVAGIIAAEYNSIGITGVAYNAKIMPLRIASSSGNVYVGYADNAFDFARTNGAYVINNSWGKTRVENNVIANGEYAWFYAPSRAEDTSVASNFKTAAEAAVNAEMVVVFSAGNNYWNSATGKVPVYRDSNDTVIDTYATSAFSAWGLATNETHIYAEYFNENSNVAGQWLAVVATDSSNVIANFSNGCGDAKAYCLAAPG
ncbi:MAG: S8 family serine peptidase, partial [Pseudomonadota bacterium]|nr:S8 family serine peptidase [Pseudomonadota bacterium]